MFDTKHMRLIIIGKDYEIVMNVAKLYFYFYQS